MVLDAYVTNHSARRFYERMGYQVLDTPTHAAKIYQSIVA
jgi:ribosomal protein S18 acetylase RimI-like enzyme